MKNKKIEVDAWFNEKTLNSFVELARGAIHVKELEKEINNLNLSPTEKEKITFLFEFINSDLYAALFDMVKVVSCLNEPFQSNTAYDAKEIIEKGEEGLANVLIKHGCSGDLPWLCLSGKSSEDIARNKQRVDEILREVKDLTQNFSREVRNELYELLLEIKGHQTAKEILDLLEPVTQGEKDWKTFQHEVQISLAYLESESVFS